MTATREESLLGRVALVSGGTRGIGAAYMSKPALAHMLQRGSGRIINISSITGEIGNVGQAKTLPRRPVCWA